MDVLADILAQHGDRPALAVGGREWSFAQIIDGALGLARTLDELDGGPLGLVGLLAHKSVTAYAGVLAAHCAGRGYMPLGIRHPASRQAETIRRSGTRILVVGPECFRLLGPLLDALGDAWPLTVVIDAAQMPAIPAGGHRFLVHRRGGRAEGATPRPRPPGAVAYLLFTSGSTGTPKGVPVSFANLAAYLGECRRRWPLTPEDRASQTFDLTFDLSVHDIFATWAAGACLHPIPDASLINPARAIRQSGLTRWFSVPSVAMFMARAGTLTPNALPTLRLSLFCGEALPVAVADRWAAAAPESRIVNLYGPTEATIAITAHEWQAGQIAPWGLVPIGRVFDGQYHCLLNDDGSVTEGRGRGELCLAGSQVTAGYLNDAPRTAERYLTLPGLTDKLWYRTGDLVERDATGLLHFVGRTDFQVKINGFRIELGEVEAALRAATGVDAVVAVPWPGADGAPRGLAAFILGEGGDSERVLAQCRRALPAYMVPARLEWRRTFPLNANGKIDSAALADQLKPERGDDACTST